MVEGVLSGAREKMKKTLESLAETLAGIRSGRASAGLVDNIKVDYYGNPTPLKGVATITIPDARSIAITPWDKGLIPAIEGAIQDSEFSVSPSNDGTAVRINFPQLTEERRVELTKIVRERAEEAKVSLRNVRHEANTQVKKMLESKQITEDDKFKTEEKLNKLIEEMNGEADKMVESKQKEMLEV